MKRAYIYKKIDAFTSGGSSGNPAAFIDTGSDRLTDSEMLKIAKEHQGFISEIVFVSRSEEGLPRLTYYSSECEVSFCGHGTIATMYEMIKCDEGLLKKTKLSIETNRKGKIEVYNNITEEDSVYISAPEAIFLQKCCSLDEIAVALRVESEKLCDNEPLDFIDAGLRTLIVPVKRLEDELTIEPDKEELKKLCISKEIDIILIFSYEVGSDLSHAHTRVFAPRFGYLEDPATGSGNSAFGYYLLKNRRWITDKIKIEQGGKNIIFNEIKLMKKNNLVLFGGRATKKIDGVYYLE